MSAYTHINIQERDEKVRIRLSSLIFLKQRYHRPPVYVRRKDNAFMERCSSKELELKLYRFKIDGRIASRNWSNKGIGFILRCSSSSRSSGGKIVQYSEKHSAVCETFCDVMHCVG